jgi:hypothetical protein
MSIATNRASAQLSTWHCHECGRIDAVVQDRRCPDCGEKVRACSRYEWFLADALRTQLRILGRPSFSVREQYPIKDHRGFTWYWDLFIWVDGASSCGGYGELIDVQGPQHDRQAKYSGPGGGYTRDYDKWWEAFSVLNLEEQGIWCRYVPNDKCRMTDGIVYWTANEIAREIIDRADRLWVA